MSLSLCLSDFQHLNVIPLSISFSPSLQQALKDNGKRREAEEKQRRARAAKEKAEREKQERQQRKKRLLEVNAGKTIGFAGAGFRAHKSNRTKVEGENQSTEGGC